MGGRGSVEVDRGQTASRRTALRCAGLTILENLDEGLVPGQNEGMNITDNELQRHYGLLLGVGLPWQVAEVKLELAEKRVKICLVWQEGQKAPCPVCGRECALYDLAPERTWRHLDTMQFETILRARTPRVECPTDGVKTILVPWA